MKRTTEIWKPIVGYEDIYMVSNLGNIASAYLNNRKDIGKIFKLKKQTPDEDGYPRVTLYSTKKGMAAINKAVHRIVLETFIGNCPKGMEGSHIDNIKSHNILYNLKWETHQENENRKGQNQSRPKGETHKNSKLTEKDILKIKTLYIPYYYSQKRLAKEFKVCEDTIYQILRGSIWKHVKV